MRLIDADELISKIYYGYNDEAWFGNAYIDDAVITMIENQPTVEFPIPKEKLTIEEQIDNAKEDDWLMNLVSKEEFEAIKKKVKILSEEEE